MALWAFGTSPHGLGIPEARFWYLSTLEYEALEMVWRNARKAERYQWASTQALMYNMWRGSGPARTVYDWLPEEDRPPQDQTPWVVKDVELQKFSIRMALSMAAEMNRGKETVN